MARKLSKVYRQSYRRSDVTNDENQREYWERRKNRVFRVGILKHGKEF